MTEATAEGHRLLCGFDFAFGSPESTVRMLTGRDSWEAVWAQIALVIQDDPNNRNNRFEAAPQLNRLSPGDGPFWGRPQGHHIPGLPRIRPVAGWGENLPPIRRFAEREVPKAQEVWKLWGAGSVGGQALTGIAALEGLRHQYPNDVQIWPFETLGEGQCHVLAEIYPSLIEPCQGAASWI